MFRQSTEWQDPALMSPLIPHQVKLLWPTTGRSVCVLSICVGFLLHSHFPLQVERLLHIVVATALADEDGVAADCHLLFVLLLQLEGALQVLIRQQNSQKNDKETQGKQLISSKRRGFVRLSYSNKSYLLDTESLDGLSENIA